MLPSDITSIDIEVTTETSNTYILKNDKSRIFGFTNDDNLTAMKQAIYKIINTERFENLIYSFNYGVELGDLFGKPAEYAIPEIERRLKEGLLQDDRITAVNNFSFIVERRTVKCTFTAVTIYGNVDSTKEVSI